MMGKIITGKKVKHDFLNLDQYTCMIKYILRVVKALHFSW